MEAQTVAQAVETLKQQGQQPSVRKVHALVGGSFRDIWRLLKTTSSELDFIQLRRIAERFSKALQHCAWDFNQISLLLGR